MQKGRQTCFNSTTVQLIPLTNTKKKQLKMSELANNKYAFYMINYVDG